MAPWRDCELTALVVVVLSIFSNSYLHCSLACVYPKLKKGFVRDLLFFCERRNKGNPKFNSVKLYKSRYCYKLTVLNKEY